MYPCGTNKYISLMPVLLESIGLNTEHENLIWCLRELLKSYEK